MHPVVWFEIPVTDMARAKAFYEHVLTIELQEQEIGPLLMAWFPMEKDAAGATGSLVKAQGYKPSLEGVLIYFTSQDIEAAIERTTHKGGRVIKAKTNIGEYGFIALIEDTEGNCIGLHSMQ